MDNKEVKIIETVIKKVVSQLYGQEAATKALCFWENEFKSSKNTFSWRAFCTRFSRDYLGVKSNELYHHIVKENIFVRSEDSRIGPEPTESEKYINIILSSVWSKFFIEVFASYSKKEKDKVIKMWSTEIKKATLNKSFDAVSWLDKIVSGDVKSAQESNLDDLEIKKLTLVLYNLACKDFNPVFVDKALSKAIDIVQASPCASGARVRQILF